MGWTASARVTLHVVVALLAAACGTRLTDTQIESAAYGMRAGEPTASAAADDGSDQAGVQPDPSDLAHPTDTGAGNISSDTPIATPGASRGQGSTSGATTSGAPIVLGQVGTFSGILGAPLIGFRQAMQAWVASVNARGGINGHPLKVISKDDGGDGATGAAEAKDLVENQHVLAFIASPLISSGPSLRPYLEQKRIPLVGGDVLEPFWHESPMLFPELEFINNLHYATAAGPIQSGKKNFALLSCAELAACSTAAPYQRTSVVKLGGKVVYEAKISLAAPDYTAQCIQARQSGADVLWLVTDPATVSRVATSCGRQGFHPAFTAAGGSIGIDFASNRDLEGFRGALPSFPWFITSGSPAFEEYGATMKRYAPDAPLQPSTSQGWASVKLFEKAVSGTIKAGETPTTDAILRGLWSIKNETLGGLTPPITFATNQPAARGACSYIIGVQAGKLVTPNGLNLVCGTP